MDERTLMARAKDAAAGAYSPYSHFRVGCALLCVDGTIVTGANVENRSFGLTNCAERTAVFAAVSRGLRSFEMVAIYTPDSADPVSPCGACRQVLSEFCDGDMKVIFGGSSGVYESMTISALFPYDSLQELKRTL